MAGERLVYTAGVFDEFGGGPSHGVPDYSKFHVRFQPPVPAGALGSEFLGAYLPPGGKFGHRVSTENASVWTLEIGALPEHDPVCETIDEFYATEDARATGRAYRLQQAGRFVAGILEELNGVENASYSYGMPVDIPRYTEDA